MLEDVADAVVLDAVPRVVLVRPVVGPDVVPARAHGLGDGVRRGRVRPALRRGLDVAAVLRGDAVARDGGRRRRAEAPPERVVVAVREDDSERRGKRVCAGEERAGRREKK